MGTHDRLRKSRVTLNMTFTQDLAFLSNFYPCNIEVDGILYSSVEHAYQAQKAVSREDKFKIKYSSSPGWAKRLGGQIKIRPGWDKMRLNIMEGLLRQKFSKSPLKEKLLDTGDTPLIENNHWGDTFWGKCRGEGKNHLGRLLMKIRKELREDMIL